MWQIRSDLRRPAGWAVERTARPGSAWTGEAAGRLARLAPSLIAVYELRYVLAHGAGAVAAVLSRNQASVRAVCPWLMVLLALGAVDMLIDIGRGLGGRFRAPRWSVSLARRWLVSSSALWAVLCCEALSARMLGHGHAAGVTAVLGVTTWSSVLAALGLGLVIAVSFGGARWVLGKVADLGRPVVVVPRLGDGRVVGWLPDALRPAPVPLLAGWSDRGPPAGLAPAVV